MKRFLRAILGNPDVLGSNGWYQMLQNDFWGTPLTDSGSHGSYRPLCVASFKINYLLDGFKPLGYHLVNVLLHCMATALVVRLARHILPSRYGVAIAGLLFAAHPIHTEAVAGVVGRADLTACVFYLLALLAYIRHIHWRQCCDLRHWLALGLTILLAAAAVLCKETAVTALVVCAIYDIIKGYAGSRDKFTNHLTIFHFSASFQLRFRSVGILALALGSIMHTRLSLPQPTVLFSTADNPTAKIGSRWTRFLTFAYLPVFNFRLLLYPDVLSFDWGMDAIPRISTLFDGKNVLSAAFYGGLAVALWINVQTLLRQSVPNVNSSFSRKLASKLVMARSNGGPEEQQRIDDSCRYCKHEFGMHHSNQCRAMHNNNMSSLSYDDATAKFNSSAAILISTSLLILPFLPATNVLFYVGFVVAERILYLPSVGYCLLIGLGVSKLIDGKPQPSRKRQIILGCFGALLLVYSGKTLLRNLDWQDEESLFRSAISVNPPKVSSV
ncbi:AAEL009761-PA [Aedes aegypti]|uniref:AAEL009761-PA n=1 Tax=Aedes aegypti TaxID=7159 RepID=Q16UX9_AEDAE|nr:AAEL009761-PA [Aedes aegypti]